MVGFLSQPGSLEGSFNAGRQNLERREAHQESMAAGELERMLAGQRGQREEELHPLNMQGKKIANDTGILGMESTRKKMELDEAEETRKKQDQEWKQAKELAAQYGAIGAELEQFPEGARMEVLNKRLGGSAQGRQLYKAFEDGVAKGTITRADIPKALAEMNKKIIEGSAAYKTTVDSQAMKGDAALERTNLQLQNKLDNTALQGSMRADNAARQGQRDLLMQQEKFHLRDNEKAEQHKRELELLERKIKSNEKIAELKTKASGGSSHKTYQALGTAYLERALEEKDVEAKEELRAKAIEAFEHASQLKASGVKASDSVIETGSDGKAGIGQKDRARPAPGAKRDLPTMPSPKTPEEAAALPSGTRFIDPNGKVRTRP